jgi:hypothetical protein
LCKKKKHFNEQIKSGKLKLLKRVALIKAEWLGFFRLGPGNKSGALIPQQSLAVFVGWKLKQMAIKFEQISLV